MIGRRKQRLYAGIVTIGLTGTALAGIGWLEAGAAFAQAATPAQNEASNPAPAAGAYQPKFPGDPARSDSESNALGYMRVVLRAEREYKKRHGKYAESLPALAGTASFTKRMAQSMDRGDYTAGFRPHKAKDDTPGFILTMTPKQMDAQHRSFYAEEDGVIRGDDQKAAGPDSPKTK